MKFIFYTFFSAPCFWVPLFHFTLIFRNVNCSFPKFYQRMQEELEDSWRWWAPAYTINIIIYSPAMLLSIALPNDLQAVLSTFFGMVTIVVQSSIADQIVMQQHEHKQSDCYMIYLTDEEFFKEEDSTESYEA